ncbi:hypothetical protein QBC47DRAFT_387964 [Echria macrotheca]|uniref:Uncharacterized protein n=1 Tax=Echria macrotheca TaxID=438768 RepID=A0AAJ0B9F5_9PEZI|nr:hypothetical protein QBC47DRAFT_387964 [Echria macrotheca]
MSDRRGRSRRSDYYDDDYVYERPPRHRSLGRQAMDKLEGAMEKVGLGAAAGALTSYHHGRGTYSHDDHRHYDDYYYESDYPRRERARHREYHSASPTRYRSHSHHRGRRESTSSSYKGSSSRSRSRWSRGIEAAVDAAAIEAFRLRHEPGPWKGAKGSRVATAAISAGVIGAATEHGHDHGHSQAGALTSAIGGLVVNRLVNGPRKEVRYDH